MSPGKAVDFTDDKGEGTSARESCYSFSMQISQFVSGNLA